MTTISVFVHQGQENTYIPCSAAECTTSSICDGARSLFSSMISCSIPLVAEETQQALGIINTRYASPENSAVFPTKLAKKGWFATLAHRLLEEGMSPLSGNGTIILTLLVTEQPRHPPPSAICMGCRRFGFHGLPPTLPKVGPRHFPCHGKEDRELGTEKAACVQYPDGDSLLISAYLLRVREQRPAEGRSPTSGGTVYPRRIKAYAFNRVETRSKKGRGSCSDHAAPRRPGRRRQLTSPPPKHGAPALDTRPVLSSVRAKAASSTTAMVHRLRHVTEERTRTPAPLLNLLTARRSDCVTRMDDGRDPDWLDCDRFSADGRHEGSTGGTSSHNASSRDC